MCYDISFTINIEELADYFPDIVFDEQLNFDFGNIDHIQGVGVFNEHPIIFIPKDSEKIHCTMMTWSCLEFYAKEIPDVRKRNGMLNIRSERVLDDPKSYWHKIKSKRCLIPMTAIYEHRKVTGLKKKVPYHIKPKDQRIFFIPGLYSAAELVDKETGEMVKHWSFALMTEDANSIMQQIHNDGENKWRMPLFLPFETAREFIQKDLTPQRYREILSFHIASKELECTTVYTIRGGSIRPDDKAKNDFFQWENVPDLIDEDL